jgi:antirestriction protein ArdC
MKNSKEIYAEVTRKVIEALEQGVKPWIRPWDSSLTDGAPTNFSTRAAYRGVNILMLNLAQFASGFDHGLWLTYSQAKALGGNVKKGEKSPAFVVKYKMLEREVDGANGERESIRFPMLRPYPVFNIAQCEGLDLSILENPEKQNWNDHKAVDKMVKKTGAAIKHGGDRACFIPSLDRIDMPSKTQFKERGDYYATLVHELVHWTGHKSRLDRLTWAGFGTESYAKEELVAELGSAFLSAKFKLDGKLQHASYIKSWLKALNDDHSLIFKASTKAQAAVDYLQGVKHEYDAEEEKKAA